MHPTTGMSAPELLAAIQNRYDLFQRLLAGLDAGQMDQPGAVGKWSVKDTVAHIVVHEQRMVEWLRARMRGEHPSTFQPYEMPEQELNRLNEQIYQENLSRDLDDILCDLDKVHAGVLQLAIGIQPEYANEGYNYPGQFSVKLRIDPK